MNTTKLEAGQVAPQFVLPNHDGASVSLADFRGSKVIVYFYPEADTPACTTQACAFNDGLVELRAAGFTVLGISKDSIADLARFASTYGLRFPLLSDETLTAHKKYGTWGEKVNYGRTYLGTIRSTFVIDEQGVVTHVFYNAKGAGHLEMLRKRLNF